MFGVFFFVGVMVFACVVWVISRMKDPNLADPSFPKMEIKPEIVTPASEEEATKIEPISFRENIVVESQTPKVVRVEIRFGQVFWPVFWAIILASLAMGVLYAIVRAIN